MAWTSMHFAVGMAGAGIAAVSACLVFRRGWRWLPVVMTLGGLWAAIPDMPRIFREDIVINASVQEKAKHAERWLHQHGTVFFFHKQLDAQPNEYALHGLLLIILQYNAAIALLLALEHRQRHSIGNRAWRAHSTRRTPSRLSGAEKAGESDRPPLRLADAPRSSHLSRVS